MDWRYSDWFEPLSRAPEHPALQQAEDYVVRKRIESHPFFVYAKDSRSALAAWVSQEVVVTGIFAQLLLKVAAEIKNVHIRAIMMEVISGEHGSNTPAGVASRSHPWLLHKLRVSMELQENEITPFAETEEFLQIMYEECSRPLSGIAALGIGNERLLVPEYTAVKQTFEHCWPEAAYKGFLNANIQEDINHSKLMREIAGELISKGGLADEYLNGASRSVDARYTFYDKLLARVSS